MLGMCLSCENMSISAHSKNVKCLHRILLVFVSARNVVLARVALTAFCADIVLLLMLTMWCCLLLLTVCQTSADCGLRISPTELKSFGITGA